MSLALSDTPVFLHSSHSAYSFGQRGVERSLLNRSVADCFAVNFEHKGYMHCFLKLEHIVHIEARLGQMGLPQIPELLPIGFHIQAKCCYMMLVVERITRKYLVAFNHIH